MSRGAFLFLSDLLFAVRLLADGILSEAAATKVKDTGLTTRHYNTESWLQKKDRFWLMVTAGVTLASVLLCAELARAQTPPAPAVPPVSVVPAQSSPLYREVIDDAGRTVRVPQPVARIVSLAPSLTETVYALGLQDRLVGDTDYCDYPPDAQKKPKVGGTTNPSIEEVAALRPDVVLVASVNRFETVRALDDLNIPVYETDPHDVKEIIASTTKLAEVLGAAQNGAALAADLEQRLTNLQQRLKELPPRRVLFVVWTDPLISIGKNTFIADALSKAGAISIVDAMQDWPHVSLEEAVQLQPEFLVFAGGHDENSSADLQALSARPGWRSLEAVRNHRFAVISEAVDRPAPRIVSAIEELARQLHPEAFLETPETPAPTEKQKSEPDNPAPTKPAIPPGGRLSGLHEECREAQAGACDR